LVIIRRTAAKTQQHPFPDDTTALHWPLNWLASEKALEKTMDEAIEPRPTATAQS
jgi:hypothetical protein